MMLIGYNAIVLYYLRPLRPEDDPLLLLLLPPEEDPPPL
jgi:hypothetical protein